MKSTRLNVFCRLSSRLLVWSHQLSLLNMLNFYKYKLVPLKKHILFYMYFMIWQLRNVFITSFSLSNVTSMTLEVVAIIPLNNNPIWITIHNFSPFKSSRWLNNCKMYSYLYDRGQQIEMPRAFIVWGTSGDSLTNNS